METGDRICPNTEHILLSGSEVKRFSATGLKIFVPNLECAGLAALWPTFAEVSWAQVAPSRKKLDLQLNGDEKQDKAAPGLPGLAALWPTFAEVSWAQVASSRKKLDLQLNGDEKQDKAAPGLPSLAVLWPTFAEVSWAQVASSRQQLDSQLNGNEEQAKAAPGHHTPKCSHRYRARGAG